MRLGIVILNYMNYEQTKNCVQSIFDVNQEAHILIVDNNSPNESYINLKEIYKKSNNIEVIKNHENAGYARGNNFGIKYLINKYSDIDYIAIMNPDVELCEKQYFDKLIRILDNRNNFAVISGLMITNGTIDTSYAGWKLPTKSEVIWNGPLSRQWKRSARRICDDGLIYIDVVSGSCFLIRRLAFEKVGLFDERTFLYNEENILGIKLKKEGYVCGIYPKLFYKHNHIPKRENVNKIQIASRIVFCKTWYEGRKALYSYYNSKSKGCLFGILCFLHCAYFSMLEIAKYILFKIKRVKN